MSILLLDIGNTHTHAGVGDARRVLDHMEAPTRDWFRQPAGATLRRLVPRGGIDGACLCSVVPKATAKARAWLRGQVGTRLVELTHRNVTGVGIDYPRPSTIGSDRLANAIAAFHRFGAPVVVVDFGTAVTFDVVDRRGNYSGGIIAPGLAAMTGYLHEKTALLPRITIRETRAVIGKSTEEAMLIGAVHGYRGLIQALVKRLKDRLRCRRLPVVATGGCARLMARGVPEITAVNPLLTLEGLRLAWMGRDGR